MMIDDLRVTTSLSLIDLRSLRSLILRITPLLNRASRVVGIATCSIFIEILTLRVLSRPLCALPSLDCRNNFFHISVDNSDSDSNVMLVDKSPPSCSISPSLLQFAQEWVDRDPNETTAAHVQQLIQDKNQQALQTLFPTVSNGDSAASAASANDGDGFSFQRIGFGTAGLRSSMTPGPCGMNDLVVLQTAQGLARHCEEQQKQQQNDYDETTTKLCAVIGYDHRSNPAMQISSLSFALLTALVFMEAGWEILLFDNFCITPLVPFALLHHQKMYYEHHTKSLAVVGVMITASHNPKQDAGYKVYWKDGCQIRSPTDQEIAASILHNLQPWTDYRKLLQERRKQYPADPCLGLSRPVETQALIKSYYTALQQSGLVTGQGQLVSPTTFDWVHVVQQNKDDKVWEAPKFCYTAMHGIGYRFAKQCFETFGLPPFVSVPTQQEPNPDFPTVAFPNPEEKGALDLAQEYACQNDCDIILANDPDADRLAVAEKNRSTGEWTVFTGDQVGVMLGLWLWQTFSRKEQEESSNPRTIAMCASTVSSKLLAEIAKVEGFHFEDTLTGFKWIGSRASHLHHKEGYRSIFCYEEAIGFCCGDVIFDKDGISAMSVFAELSIAVYRQGKSLVEHMQSIYNKYGHFVSNNGYFILKDMSVVPRILNAMTLGGNFGQLKVVGPYAVESIRFLGEPGYDSTTPDKKPTLPTSKSSPMMTIRFSNGCVAQFRASGTEPKFKYYIELKGQPGVARDSVQKELMEMSEVILEELLQPTKNGLLKPENSKL